jgi:hypothetical protein
MTRLQLLRLPASRAADGMLLSVRACMAGMHGRIPAMRGRRSRVIVAQVPVIVCEHCSWCTSAAVVQAQLLPCTADCRLVGLSHILKMVLAPAAVLLLLLPSAAVSLVAPCSVTMTAVRRLRA